MQLPSRALLIVECLTITVALPLVLMLYQPRGALFASLWLLAAYAMWQLGRMEGKRWHRPRFDWAALREPMQIRPVLRRFALSAGLLTAFTLLVAPDKLLSFPAERPLLWLLVMVLYPILSVIPQEIAFRQFFFTRYGALFPSPRLMVAASGLAFGFAHVLLSNWVAVVLSAIGGLFFAATYQKRRSLALVIVEHALYGCFLFTIGLGYFFYSGAPHKW